MTFLYQGKRFSSMLGLIAFITNGHYIRGEDGRITWG